jgi:hypothetical protein
MIDIYNKIADIAALEVDEYGWVASRRKSGDRLVSPKKALCAKKLLLKAAMVNFEISALANTLQVFAGVGAAGSARRRRFLTSS